MAIAQGVNLQCALIAAIACNVMRFVADGPSGGLVQSSPQSGYAVTTSFSGYDEGVICLGSTEESVLLLWACFAVSDFI